MILKESLSLSYLTKLYLGMDGPKVNLKFQQDLTKYFGEKGVSFLNMSSAWSPRTFKHGVKWLPIDIDQFVVDLHCIFKLPSARREDYKEIEDVTDVTARYALRHLSFRWLTLEFVLVRIIEQWENLKTYFLEFLPNQKKKKIINEKFKQLIVKSISKKFLKTHFLWLI